jgi:LCP family protein required for cell wall assembly
MSYQYSQGEPLKLNKPSRNRFVSGCIVIFLATIFFFILIAIYMLAPIRTNILLLGIDRAPEKVDLSRSDTIILLTVLPPRPYVGMLSIPRDLWVSVPGVGENRINTAHFYAELEVPGSGPSRVIDTIRQNFGVDMDYYIRIRFDGLQQIVDALGGVDIQLNKSTSLYSAGLHHLDGAQSLAFVRDRQGSDDFSRIQNGQLFMKAIWNDLRNPSSWSHLPAFTIALGNAVDTNIPIWQWPRLALAIFRAGTGGIDARVISREDVKPFTTSGGAQVLAPIWKKINPIVKDMFDQ